MGSPGKAIDKVIAYLLEADLDSIELDEKMAEWATLVTDRLVDLERRVSTLEMADVIEDAPEPEPAYDPPVGNGWVVQQHNKGALLRVDGILYRAKETCLPGLSTGTKWSQHKDCWEPI